MNESHGEEDSRCKCVEDAQDLGSAHYLLAHEGNETSGEVDNKDEENEDDSEHKGGRGGHIFC